MAATMMEKGFTEIELHLDEALMKRVHEYYKIACTQDYLLENYEISVEDAEKVARKARELEAEACMPVWDTGCVAAAAQQLHIDLVERVYNEEMPPLPAIL